MLITAGDGCLDLKVGPGSLRRALWIMDGLIKRFEGAQFRVSVKDRSTVVEQYGQSICIRIREGLQRLEVPPHQRKNSWDSHYSFRPNGLLHFEIIGPWGRERGYSDSARWRLEQKADQIVESVGGLLKRKQQEAETKRVAEIIRQYEAREDARRERRRAELQRRAESLLNDVEAWHKSERIRSYLAAFQATMEKWSGPIDAKSELGEWLHWARLYADSLDPLSPCVHS